MLQAVLSLRALSRKCPSECKMVVPQKRSQEGCCWCSSLVLNDKKITGRYLFMWTYKRRLSSGGSSRSSSLRACRRERVGGLEKPADVRPSVGPTKLSPSSALLAEVQPQQFVVTHNQENSPNEILPAGSLSLATFWRIFRGSNSKPIY